MLNGNQIIAAAYAVGAAPDGPLAFADTADDTERYRRLVDMLDALAVTAQPDFDVRVCGPRTPSGEFEVVTVGGLTIYGPRGCRAFTLAAATPTERLAGALADPDPSEVVRPLRPVSIHGGAPVLARIDGGDEAA